MEVVSSKSTEAFLAILKRFISRRNTPSHIYSDNGTNFIGARHQLQDLYNFLSVSTTQDVVKDFLLEQRVEWHFIPDRAPHFGGIWEAGVKAAKHCLKRTIGTTMLSFEELSTVFCQAEACLNSRPYLPQDSHNPAGEMPLTPGHFLTGRPLRAYPENPEVPELTLINRWSLCKHMVQYFWEIWQKTYLQSLQKCQKWHKSQPNIKVDDLVMVLEESTLLNTWKMGKVTHVFPGADGLVRTATVTVKTAELPPPSKHRQDIVIRTSHYKRQITKLAPLLSSSIGECDANIVAIRGEDVLATTQQP